MPDISPQKLQELRNTFAPLIGIKIDWLTIPDRALQGFEPSQIAVIVNTLLDGILPQIQLISTNEQNQEKLKLGQTLMDNDYEKDTNFGKLKRIPYQPLQDFLAKWTIK